MPTAKKSSRTKVTVGGLKKQPKSKLLALIIAIVLVLGVAGFFGKQAYDKHELKAKAAGWSTLYSSGGNKLSACKVGYNSPYGYIRKVKVLVYHPNATNFGITSFIIRNGVRTQATTSNNTWLGPYFMNEFTTSELANDKFQTQLYLNNKIAFDSGYRNPAYLANC